MAKKSTLSNAAFIRRILREEGFSEYGIRGSLARMRQESTLNPKARRANDAGPGRDSIGIFQWNDGKKDVKGKPGRLAQLKAFARSRGKDVHDLETQVRFFAKEAKTTEAAYGKRLINARSDVDAARAAISMARPAGWTSQNPAGGHGFRNTLNWTRSWAAKQKGESTEFYNDPEGEAAARNRFIKGAGKSLGRLQEEGEQVEFHQQLPEATPRLDALSELLHTDQLAQEQEVDESITGDTDGADPIVEHPVAEAINGFFSAMGNAYEEYEKSGKKKQIKIRPMLRSELSQAPSGGSFASILGMIKSFGS